jgi:hypothetical protein
MSEEIVLKIMLLIAYGFIMFCYGVAYGNKGIKND